MKILILDNQAHDELAFALRKHNVSVEYKNIQTDIIDVSEYVLVIVCPSTQKQLAEWVKTYEFGRANLAVFFKHLDDKFITYCNTLGCKDIIRIPYNPSTVAKRLLCLINSLSIEEPNSSYSTNQISFSLDDYIDMEIQRANRGRTPLSLLYIKPSPNSDLTDIANIVRNNTRSIDFVSIYKNNILIALPYCNKDSVYFLKSKLKKCLSQFTPAFFSITKNTYYDKPLTNEKDVLLDMLEEGIII